MPIVPISGTGNILAGTFKASIPNTHSQPQPFISPMYNNSNSPIIQPNNNNSNSPIMQPNNNINNNNNNNNCANNIPSIPTTSVNRNKNLKPPVSNSKPKPKIENLEDPKFILTYATNREAPSTNEDFHWLCYHFRSGERHSCTFGRQCKWRHYDFDLRSNIVNVNQQYASMDGLIDRLENKGTLTFEALYGYVLKKEDLVKRIGKEFNKICQILWNEIQNQQKYLMNNHDTPNPAYHMNDNVTPQHQENNDVHGNDEGKRNETVFVH